METTLCLIKPDGVRRALIGKILTAFEQRGLAIIAMRMLLASKEQALAHYSYEDIAARHGQSVYKTLIHFITSGPIVALAIEGDSAIENVRKLCGETQPLAAVPGTIRGDYAHHSFTFCSQKNKAVHNLIHASSSAQDAIRELAIWFKPEDFCPYQRSDHKEHFF